MKKEVACSRYNTSECTVYRIKHDTRIIASIIRTTIDPETT